MKVSEIKAGQRITVKYSTPVAWARKTGNPFLGQDVVKESTVAFTAAGAETYERQMEKQGRELSGKPCWHRPATGQGPCVREHAGNGTTYLAGINHNKVSSRYFVNGAPASPEQVKEILSWTKPSNEGERGTDFRLWTIEKLANAS